MISLTLAQDNLLIVPLLRQNAKQGETITNVEKKALFSPNEDIDLNLQLSKPMAFYLPVGLSLRPAL